MMTHPTKNIFQRAAVLRAIETLDADNLEKRARYYNKRALLNIRPTHKFPLDLARL